MGDNTLFMKGKRGRPRKAKGSRDVEKTRAANRKASSVYYKKNSKKILAKAKK